MQAALTGISSRYEIGEEVGRGGMAVVYRATDTTLRRQVALKILHGHLQSQPESRQRLVREARAVAKLHHPNIVEIFDYSGDDSEQAYLVTEYIHGETLESFVERRCSRMPEIALLIAEPVCEALAHAHALGVIHRDVKPGNVMIREDGTVKLMDFGIAQVLDAQGLTMTGTLLGSPAHMPPEHIEGKPLDVRADVFSTGTVLYQLAVGQLPFQGRNPHAVMRAIFDGDYPRPQSVNPRVSAGLERILVRALERDPERRYQTAQELLADVRAHLREFGIHDAAHELKAFFAAPDAYEQALERSVVAARLARGRRAIATRRQAAALEDLNQVLALEPKNAEALALLRRLGRRRAWKRLALSGVAAGVVCAGVWVAWPNPTSTPAPAPTPVASAPAPEPVPEPMPVAEAPAQEMFVDAAWDGSSPEAIAPEPKDRASEAAVAIPEVKPAEPPVPKKTLRQPARLARETAHPPLRRRASRAG
jgi:serine/threonine-protein kinase